MEIGVGVAKVKKQATSESGDTLEMIERPHGGLSLVLVDGQLSGRAAKAISNMVARKVISLLAEGVRDGAAARAAHDYLYLHRGGKVSATLNIVSLDLRSQTIVLSRNSHCPVFIFDSDGLRILDAPSVPVGVYRDTKPVISEVPMRAGTYVIVFTDGVLSAGERTGESLDLSELILNSLKGARRPAQYLADRILGSVLEMEQGRPADDSSVLVVAISEEDPADHIRRLTIRFPMGS
jgi:serine phosphatase RsbU (regulator of sigma subunit)